MIYSYVYRLMCSSGVKLGSGKPSRMLKSLVIPFCIVSNPSSKLINSLVVMLIDRRSRENPNLEGRNGFW